MQFDKNYFVYLLLNVFLFYKQYVHCFYYSTSGSSLMDLPAAFLALLVQLNLRILSNSNVSLIQ